LKDSAFFCVADELYSSLFSLSQRFFGLLWGIAEGIYSLKGWGTFNGVKLLARFE
jgi:hypothetical protein